MEGSYRRRMAAAGFYDLAAAAKSGRYGSFDEKELPFAELETEEIARRSRALWSSLLEPGGEEPAWLFLVGDRLGLSRRETYLALLGVLPWLDAGFGEAFLTLSGGKSRVPSLGLALELYELTGKGEAEQPAGFAAAERFIFPELKENGLLKPDRAFGERAAEDGGFPVCLGGFFEWKHGGEAEPDQRADRLSSYIRKKLQSKRAPAVLLLGPEGSGRKRLSCLTAAKEGKGILILKDAAGFWRAEHGFPKNRLSDLFLRETVLSGAFPAVCLSGAEDVPSVFFREVQEKFRNFGLPLFFLGETEEEAEALGLSPDISLSMELPDMGERWVLWERMGAGYPVSGEVSFEELASRYVLTPGQIEDILRLAGDRALYRGRREIDRACLEECCHDRLRRNFSGLASRVPVRFQWEDLILEPAQKKKLFQAEGQLRFRGRVFEEWGLLEKEPYGNGISMVFSGPPGTGKTMAAQVLAGRMGLELYRVDLSAVVSKYIGETEKNLNLIFEEAKKSQVILFFDEADVLFGKRTEVKDGNDRYGNLEAAFLLQKMEAYPGVTVLATNFFRNMDEAFRRRIRFFVEFPFPDRKYRKKLWDRAFPEKMPLAGDLDLDFFADTFELSGAGIRNAVHQAAFLAASEGTAVGMSQLARAVRQEMEKNGKILSREDFGPYAMYLELDGREVFDV